MLQPILQNENLLLQPLQPDDFEAVYPVASDPLIWEQHPNKDRWKRDVFRKFFDGALQSGGAFQIIHKPTGKTIGCTRFYDYDETNSSLFIGYTFYIRDLWGTGVNAAVKKRMLDYAFGFVSTVFFHVGAENVRSQIAVGRLGAQKIGEQEIAYFGEKPKRNFVYGIRKIDWQ